MRISLELLPAEGDRLEGRALTDDGRVAWFSGTLDLLRSVEELRHADVDSPPSAEPNPAFPQS